MSRRTTKTTASCSACPLRKNPCYRSFEKSELKFVERFKANELLVKAGTEILTDGQASEYLYTIQEGWCLRLKYLPEGERQVLNVSLPGDLIGLQPTLFGAMQHCVHALTDVKLCMFPRSGLSELFSNFPDLALDVTWLAAKEEVMVADHLVNVGQRSAFVRMAYIFAHIFDRAKRANLTSGNKLSLPLTQDLLADALGLSAVHTNKTLRKLRATRCIEWSRGVLTIADSQMLHELADYEPLGDSPRPFL